jgi:hypothetical protein
MMGAGACADRRVRARAVGRQRTCPVPGDVLPSEQMCTTAHPKCRAGRALGTAGCCRSPGICSELVHSVGCGEAGRARGSQEYEQLLESEHMWIQAYFNHLVKHKSTQ